MITALGVPTLNRYDLCAKLVDSARRSRPLLPDVCAIVDNGGTLAESTFQNPDMPVAIHKPGHNLGVGPSWNWLAQKYLQKPSDRLLICGDDVVLHPATITMLVHVMGKTGADFVMPDPALSTTPQMFSCFMVRSSLFTKVGYFDEKFWPAYFEDNDFHRRMKIAGAIEAVAPCGYDHLNSGTMKAFSKEEVEVHHVRFRACRDYYIEKWGGLPGAEKYEQPFNGQPEPDKLSF